MPIGYKYNPSNDLGYVNWAEVSKGFSDMLLKERDDREKRKEAYAKQDRELSQLLASAEMGQFKDGNDFLSNYVDAMTQQRLIDYRMFKRGLLKEKDYVLKTNNAIDGTNTMFAVQKKWQAEAKRVMEGIAKNELQQLNNFNMATIQGFADFSNSKAVIDPNTGVVNVGKLKLNKETGIMELTKEIMPVNLAFRTLSTDIATYDTDGVTTKFVGGLGTLKDAIVQAATTNRAGSVTSFVGPEAFSKYPKSKDVIQNFNKAIDQYIDGQLENPYNLTSVLTENTGLYDSESFTYDKDIAASDPTKILLKVDPGTKLPVPDRESPNYKKQFGEAKDYMRTQILSKIDRERSIQAATGQLSDNFNVGRFQAQTMQQQARNLAENLGKFITGTPEDATAAQGYLAGLGIKAFKTGNKLTVYRGTTPIEFNLENTDPSDIIKSVVGAANPRDLNEDMVVKEGVKMFKGKKINLGTSTAAPQAPPAERNYSAEFSNIVGSIDPSIFFKKKEGEVVKQLQPILSKLNIKVSPSGGALSNYVTLSSPGKPPLEVGTNAYTEGGANEFKSEIDKWLAENFPTAELQQQAITLGEVSGGGNPAPR